MIKKSDTVEHFKFGKGTVLEVRDNYAIVDFLNFGKKSLLLDVLSLVGENNQNNKLTKLSLIDTAIQVLVDNRREWMRIDEMIPHITEKIIILLPFKTLENVLKPADSLVFKNHLMSLKEKVIQDGTGQETIDFIEDTTGHNASVQQSEKEYYEEFVSICNKLRVDHAIAAFYVRALLFLSAKASDTTIKLRDIKEYIYNAFLYQISIGEMFNVSNSTNENYYEIIKDIYDNGTGDKEAAIAQINKYLMSHVVHQFLVCNDIKSKLYIVEDDSISFQPGVLKLIANNANKIDKSIINKLAYFLSKNNPDNLSVSAYISDLKNGNDVRTKVIEKFEYLENLSLMREYLDRDVYSTVEFKKIMGEFEIPVTKSNLKKCLDRLDYRLRTKNLVLSNKYPSLKAFYRETIPDEDIYRYSNPENLEDYDRIIKELNSELFLIEIESGVYLTSYNLDKNGITESVIKRFHNRIKSLGENLVFFSVKEIKLKYPNDDVVQFCSIDDNQLKQFVLAAEKIHELVLSNGDTIYYFGECKDKGAFLTFIMTGRPSMSVYDIEDYAEDKFGVEYQLEDIEDHVACTDFFYSPEMEKIYRSKSLFLREVYGDESVKIKY